MAGGGLIAGSLIGGALGLGGSYMQGEAQKDAASEAAKVERQRLAMMKPFIESGYRGLEQFESGINQAPTYADILAGVESDPGYQFQLEQGMNAIQGSAAANNNLLSGRTLKGLLEYGQGLGTQYAGQAYNRELGAFQNRQNQLLSLISAGVQGAGAPSALPQLALAGGQASANQIGGMTNALTGGLSNLYLASLLKQGGGTPYAGSTPLPYVGGVA